MSKSSRKSKNFCSYWKQLKPPRCETCGSVMTFYKGKYRSWCPICDKHHAYQHCKSGWFESEKIDGGKFYYRSSHELKACELLHNDKKVDYFSRGPIVVLPSGSRYFVDYFVKYLSGGTRLIEVKPEERVFDLVVQEKAQTAAIYARDNNIDEVIFWTERNLYEDSQRMRR